MWLFIQMGPPTRLSLDLDPEFGGFEEAVEVPLDIDVSVKSFSFRLMWLQQDAVAQQVRLAGNGAPAAAILWPSLASEPATRESRNGGYDPDGMRRPPSDVAGGSTSTSTHPSPSTPRPPSPALFHQPSFCEQHLLHMVLTAAR